MKKQRWEESEKRKEEERRSEKRKSQKKEDAGARKVRKVARHCVFRMAPEGRKVGSLKRRVRSHLGRWKMKNCMPLWREAHFEVKMDKTYQVRTTFGSWDVEKVHAVVARRCAKHISKSKCTKHDTFAPLLDVQMPFCVAGARDYAPCQKWAKREGFVAFPKTMAGVGHLKRICKDGFRVAGAVQETCSSEMLGGQAGFPERGCILEHQIFRFAQIILRDRCSTSYDLASLFVAGAVV